MKGFGATSKESGTSSTSNRDTRREVLGQAHCMKEESIYEFVL